MYIETCDLKTQKIPGVVPIGEMWIAGCLEFVGTKMKVRLMLYLVNIETGEEY